MTIEQAILELIAETSDCEIPECNHQATLPFFLCEKHTQILVQNVAELCNITVDEDRMIRSCL